MTWFLSKIMGALGGGLFDRLFQSIDHAGLQETERQRLRARVIEAQVEADAATRQQAMQNKWFWRAWSLFALPLGLWWALVLIDTALDLPIVVHDLPDSVRPWADTIFYGLFGAGAGLRTAETIASAITRRR
ncbi:hypothetical protein [Polycladidibacter hongkongensis]|uniref:hypothetical protein n=1 Tax=Polycladidibacter hongkongensis TaxID=1647556 RepID=UPI000833A451|nr:hypothetical protein [Pseudovibrio hongkongensis]